ncbi:MAG: carbamoyltransferase [Candidatus Saccharibacteria bacterium]
MGKAVLGISAFYHDSAAALIQNGRIIAAAQEERFTRKKNDDSFPDNAIQYCLKEAGVELNDLQCIVFYDKPFIKFERLLETYHAFAPKGLISFINAIPVWLKDKLFMKSLIQKQLKSIGNIQAVPILFSEHHLSHAASAFYPSPFEEAAILTIDGVGEWATTTISHGKENKITILKELHFPHSIGLLYSAFTYYCGFRVNSGEYKLMGLAPYGIPDSEQVAKYKQLILNQLIDVRSDGSLLLNMDYFNFATGLTMCNNSKWEQLFDIKKREEESEITQPYMNMALAIQQVTDDIVLKLARTAKALTGCSKLVMAGGVALNCVSNGKIYENGLFEDLWIQPAAGDAGGALGAALAVWHLHLENKMIIDRQDSMLGSYLGPSFNDQDISRLIHRYDIPCRHFEDFDTLASHTASLIDSGKVIGWFQGRMEFGPRALGNRSIIGDARNPEMQKKMNLKIKYRESFRPFAPAVLEEDISNYCQYDVKSPYMLLVMPVVKERCYALPDDYNKGNLFNRLYFLRSDIPAITHIDYSARVQTVSKATNERFWKVINEFKKLTGYGIIINTSFNVRGEPIVCTPMDAFRCFMNSEIDYLVLNDYLFEKSRLTHLKDEFAKNYKFSLD